MCNKNFVFRHSCILLTLSNLFSCQFLIKFAHISGNRRKTDCIWTCSVFIKSPKLLHFPFDFRFVLDNLFCFHMQCSISLWKHALCNSRFFSTFSVACSEISTSSFQETQKVVFFSDLFVLSYDLGNTYYPLKQPKSKSTCFQKHLLLASVLKIFLRTKPSKKSV